MKQVAPTQYARALFHAASRSKELEEIRAALNSMLDLMKKTPRFKQFLEAPFIFGAQKRELLGVILKKERSSLLLEFIMLLSHKGLLGFLPEIVKRYENILDQHLGVVRAKLITATPIEASLRKRWMTLLENRYHKKIELHEKVDPSIMGGAIAYIDQGMIDFSLKTRLGRLKKQLLLHKE